MIVFTTYDSDADIVRAVDAGAMGYLLKDAAPAKRSSRPCGVRCRARV
jgi:DNA-binding NarL/FixJ family response regulator